MENVAKILDEQLKMLDYDSLIDDKIRYQSMQESSEFISQICNDKITKPLLDLTLKQFYEEAHILAHDANFFLNKYPDLSVTELEVYLKLQQ